jgi:hypothetical protein
MQNHTATIKTMVVAAALGLTLLPSEAQAKMGWGKRDCNNNRPGMTAMLSEEAATSLTAQEEEGLLFMLEEEKLARDVYREMAKKWNHQSFARIADSEQRHMDAVAVAMEKYRVVHQTVEQPGNFSNETLQALYDQLVEQGSKSLVDAFTVGATIEDLDIKDLQEHLSHTDNRDLKTIYQNLAKGSRNHMRAFTGLLAQSQVGYAAQYITQDELEKIIASPHERGRVDAEGQQVTGSRQRGRM